MTPEQRKRVEFLADPRWFLEEAALAPRVCLEERDAFEAVARRVHAEFGPEEHGEYHKCKTCLRWEWKRRPEGITHKLDCLWLTAEALKKAGAI